MSTIKDRPDDPVHILAGEERLNRAVGLQGRKDGIGEAIQAAAAACRGVESLLKNIEALRPLAESAKSAGCFEESYRLMARFDVVGARMDEIVANSRHKGTNLLAGPGETLDITINPDEPATLTLAGENAARAGLGIAAVQGLGLWWDWTDNVPDRAAIDNSLAQLAGAKAALVAMAQNFVRQLRLIQTLSDFTDELIRVLKYEPEAPVPTGPDPESAAGLMSRTQQSLAVNFLSIASESYALLLRLFS
ncbi:MAG: hypothetical protein V1816_27195 [Pseudomonadota bacterium]